MQKITATLDADTGVVEVAKRGDDLANHGYFLGVRPDEGSGAFVALTRDEAEAVAYDLTARVDPLRCTPAQRMTGPERLIWLLREEERANALADIAEQRAQQIRAELRSHLGKGDTLRNSLRLDAGRALVEAALSGDLRSGASQEPDQSTDTP
jgi:hypothetical protein